MKTMARMELKPDMILAQDVSYNSNILYSAGTKLDQFMIDRLGRYNIMCVSIMEKADLATTKYEKLLYDDQFLLFCKRYESILMSYKQEMLQFINTGIAPEDHTLLSLYADLAKFVPSGLTLLDYFYSMMPNEDELTFTHCLNSALLAGVIADMFALDSNAKNTLLLCAFYYDIGKLTLPYQILWKSSGLTEEERKLIKKHPEIGYQFVMNAYINQQVKNTILMHHERMDGTGYPFGISGDKIGIFSRYMSIIDSYVAMASPRSYRSALMPLQILEVFRKDLSKYDASILLPIMEKISNAQIGEKIHLSDESFWEVSMINKNNYDKPLLRNDKNEFLDLATRNDLKIIS